MSNLRIVKYNPEHSNEWDAYVQNSINGTIFHERKFISYHGDKFTDESILIYRNDEILSVFPAASIQKSDIKVIKSHPGTSYGGLVFKDYLHLKDIFEILKSIEEYYGNNNFNRIEFRQSPKLFLKNPMDQLDFALLHNGYYREDEELSTYFSLEQYKEKSTDEMLYMFNHNTRNKVRKNVKKGIRKNLSFNRLSINQLKEYYKILLSNLEKHEVKPAHTEEEIKTLLELYPERVRLYGVYYQDILIAGYLIFNINSNGFHIFYGSADYEYQKLRATSFGLFMLIQTLADEGWKYLNMGISTEDGGKNINWSLFDFKESFNGSGILRTYWIKEL